jgi:hypothetical protein
MSDLDTSWPASRPPASHPIKPIASEMPTSRSSQSEVAPRWPLGGSAADPNTGRAALIDVGWIAP